VIHHAEFNIYAAFFFCWDRSRAHRALAAAAILFRPSGDKPRLAEAAPCDFAGSDCFRDFAHLALWALAIFLLAAVDIVLFGLVRLAVTPIPLPVRLSMAKIAFSNF